MEGGAGGKGRGGEWEGGRRGGGLDGESLEGIRTGIRQKSATHFSGVDRVEGSGIGGAMVGVRGQEGSAVEGGFGGVG